MVALFVEHSPSRLASAREALAAGDIATVQRMTHMLKSSSAQLGAMRLNYLSADAEARAERGDTESIGMLLDGMGAEFERWHEWVRTVQLDSASGA